MGVWGDDSWSNYSWGWGNSVQDLTEAVSRNYKDRDTYQVFVKFVINVDDNTWSTKDIWSDLYEFDLWQGVYNEDESEWCNIYLFDNNVCGLCLWGDYGSTNPQFMGYEFGNYQRNDNEIILYNPEDSEQTSVFTINGDVMTSEDMPGVEFKKL